MSQGFPEINSMKSAKRKDLKCATRMGVHTTRFYDAVRQHLESNGFEVIRSQSHGLIARRIGDPKAHRLYLRSYGIGATGPLVPDLRINASFSPTESLRRKLGIEGSKDLELYSPEVKIRFCPDEVWLVIDALPSVLSRFERSDLDGWQRDLAMDAASYDSQSLWSKSANDLINSWVAANPTRRDMQA